MNRITKRKYSISEFFKNALLTYVFSYIALLIYYIIINVFIENCELNSIGTGYTIVLGALLIAPMLTFGLMFLQAMVCVLKIPCRILGAYLPTFLFVCILLLMYEYSEVLIGSFLYTKGTQFYRHYANGVEVFSNRRYEYDYIFWLFSYSISSIFTVFISWTIHKIHQSHILQKIL